MELIEEVDQRYPPGSVGEEMMHIYHVLERLHLIVGSLQNRIAQREARIAGIEGHVAFLLDATSEIGPDRITALEARVVALEADGWTEDDTAAVTGERQSRCLREMGERTIAAARQLDKVGRPGVEIGGGDVIGNG
jgi:hypothetical protein